MLTSKSLSRAGVVQILSTSWAAEPPHHLAFRTYLCEPQKRQNDGKTQHFAQFLPAKTSLLSNIDAARATGNFQYSRKLELLNFLWLSAFEGLVFVFFVRVCVSAFDIKTLRIWNCDCDIKPFELLFPLWLCGGFTSLEQCSCFPQVKFTSKLSANPGSVWVDCFTHACEDRQLWRGT